MDRPRTPRLQDREGTVHDSRKVRGLQQRVCHQRKRCHHGALVRQLVQLAPAMAQACACIDARDHQHRHGILIGLRHRGDRIGQARAGDHQRDTGFPGHASISVRHEPGPLFVARGDVADFGGSQPPIKLDRVHAGNAEDGFHAIGFKNIDQGLTDRFGHYAHLRFSSSSRLSAKAAMRSVASESVSSATVNDNRMKFVA